PDIIEISGRGVTAEDRHFARAYNPYGFASRRGRRTDGKTERPRWRTAGTCSIFELPHVIRRKSQIVGLARGFAGTGGRIWIEKSAEDRHCLSGGVIECRLSASRCR